MSLPPVDVLGAPGRRLVPRARSSSPGDSSDGALRPSRTSSGWRFCSEAGDCLASANRRTLAEALGERLIALLDDRRYGVHAGLPARDRIEPRLHPAAMRVRRPGAAVQGGDEPVQAGARVAIPALAVPVTIERRRRAALDGGLAAPDASPTRRPEARRVRPVVRRA